MKHPLKFEEAQDSEANEMDMHSPMMQVMHSIMMWLHQQGFCPMQMPM